MKKKTIGKKEKEKNKIIEIGDNLSCVLALSISFIFLIILVYLIVR